MKKLLAFLISSMILAGFAGCGLSRPRNDVMLKWFDVTEYMGELVDFCYGDGYVNWVIDDPSYCPPYTLATLNAKLEIYIADLGLTFVKYVGKNVVGSAVDSLQVDFVEGVTDPEVLSRVMYIKFVTCLALDGEGNEKIVYLPTYVPQGSTTTAFVYDQMFGVTYTELQTMVAENADACIVRVLSHLSGADVVDAMYCLSDGLLDELRLTRTDGGLDDELQYTAFIDTYVMQEGIWTKVDNVSVFDKSVYLRCTEAGITVSYDSRLYDQEGDPVYDLLFTMPYLTDPAV